MQLAVNKEIRLANGNNLTNSTVNIGVPVYYQIQIIGSVAAGTFNVNDVLPPGFVQTGPVTCTVVTNATCPAPGTMIPPSMGPFTTTAVGGQIILRIPGFFQVSGPMVNVATATATTGGATATSQIQVTVPGSAIPADVTVRKTVTPSSVVLSNTTSTLDYSITVTNTSTTQNLYLGGTGLNKILKLTDVIKNFTGVTANFATSNFGCTSTGGAHCVAEPADATAVLQPFTAWTAFVATYPAIGFNAPGYLPANSSFTLEFTLDISTTSCPGPSSANIENEVKLEMFNNITSIGDSDFSNNTAKVTTPITFGPAASNCTGPVTLSKVVKTPASGPYNFGLSAGI